jgi:hypothetical protein
VYFDTTEKRQAKLFAECQWNLLADISADDFRAWREKRRSIRTPGKLRGERRR